MRQLCRSDRATAFAEPTVVGATRVLNVKDIFSDENIREDAPEPIIQTVPREGKLRVTAIHHYIDMTISMPKEVR
uniref:Uncharacterized protein n=1 Tax=Ascaris lumbricoides TaxID=6252 RepID=A0A9J2Q9A4_ASCLU